MVPCASGANSAHAKSRGPCTSPRRPSHAKSSFLKPGQEAPPIQRQHKDRRSGPVRHRAKSSARRRLRLFDRIPLCVRHLSRCYAGIVTDGIVDNFRRAGLAMEEVAHGAARLLGFELVTGTRLEQWLAQEFGDAPIPDRAWKPAVVSILARMAVANHLVVAIAGAEALFGPLPMLLRAGVVAPAARRIGNVMLDQRLERSRCPRSAAKLDQDAGRSRRARLGRAKPVAEAFDIVLNAEHMDASQMTEVLCAAAGARQLVEHGLLPAAAEAQIQFQTRLQLARSRIVPAGHANIKRAVFGHPSEELFANLLNFYRIEWEYEPRSFALQWDKDGNIVRSLHT